MGWDPENAVAEWSRFGDDLKETKKELADSDQQALYFSVEKRSQGLIESTGTLRL
jgi:hypothetical protein